MLVYLRRIGKFEIISFGTGFAMMAFELLAARLLAPSIGSSIYIWTSVIGVIIAALSIGYALGGKLADRRVKAADITWLLLSAAALIVGMALIAPVFLAQVVTVFHDARLQGVVASFVLFAPTSLLLGMISPYLVRLRVTSTKTSGESVALLSALNAIGGISGTFLTGFIFFSFVGTMQALVIIAGVLVVLSWLIIPRSKWKWRLIATVVLILWSWALLLPIVRQPGIMATVDTPSSTYQVREVSIGNKTASVLITGPTGFQSGALQDGSDELVFFYTKKIAEIVKQMPKKDRILVLGGGAFTLPRYLAHTYPHSQVDTVEIDPELETIAKDYFFYQRSENSRVIGEDARTFLNKNQTKYDVVIVDVYNDTYIPFAMATKEYAKQLARAMQPGGIVIVNMIAGENKRCQPLFSSITAPYASIFSEVVMYPRMMTDAGVRQNIVAVYGSDAMTWLSRKGSAHFTVPKVAAFSDNFAPIERLSGACR